MHSANLFLLSSTRGSGGRPLYLNSTAGKDERAHAAKKRLLEYRNAPRPLLTDGGGGGGGGGGRAGLAERLKVYTADDADPVPGPLMRKYIAYARTHVHPVLSPEAKKVSLSKAWWTAEGNSWAPQADGQPDPIRSLLFSLLFVPFIAVDADT